MYKPDNFECKSITIQHPQITEWNHTMENIYTAFKHKHINSVQKSREKTEKITKVLFITQ